jgi:hypothetical protein
VYLRLALERTFSPLRFTLTLSADSAVQHASAIHLLCTASLDADISEGRPFTPEFRLFPLWHIIRSITAYKSHTDIVAGEAPHWNNWLNFGARTRSCTISDCNNLKENM